jgi:hypothetical protein
MIIGTIPRRKMIPYRWTMIELKARPFHCEQAS